MTGWHFPAASLHYHILPVLTVLFCFVYFVSARELKSEYSVAEDLSPGPTRLFLIIYAI